MKERIHKYRIWDKTRKQMLFLRSAELSDVTGAHIALAFEEYGHTRNAEEERLEDYVVMQFIGLDNKNDELYEGDVIKYFNRTGVAVYNPDKAAYCLYTNDSEPSSAYVQLDKFVMKDIINIGNIYETKGFEAYTR